VLPDIAILDGRVTERIPFAVIEISSPSESLPKALRKLAEYHVWGVKNIWLIDPDQRTVGEFDGVALKPIQVLSLREHDVSIQAADLFRAADRLAPNV
jgi:Uma2 family endonuclease